MIVDLNLSEDQAMIADSIGGLLRDRLPVSRFGDENARGGAAERALWSDLAELGLFGLGVAEDDGGVGLGAAEEVLAAQALGEHLASPALLAQIAAAHLADDSGLRQALVRGTTRATLAVGIGGGEAQAFDAEGAAHLVLFGPAGARLIAMPAGTPGASIDESLSASTVPADDAARQRTPADDRISLLLAAYLTGIARAAEAMAVAYARVREQFGQPIGAFQAIKHQCADMEVRAAAAEAQVRYAATLFGSGGANDAAEVAAARLLATRAALDNARGNIQIHGGMGFTAECDAHLFLKRAHVIAALDSSRAAEQARLLAV